MSHTQHTPGPWEVSYRDLSVQIYGANGSGIGEVYGWSAGSQAVQQEAFANAHLIAAAPELYEALSYFVDDISDRFDIDAPSTNPGIRQCIVMGRAALAKARGES